MDASGAVPGSPWLFELGGEGLPVATEEGALGKRREQASLLGQANGDAVALPELGEHATVGDACSPTRTTRRVIHSG